VTNGANPSMVNHVDLFSGIGGFALAATWTWGDQYRNLAHSEVEKFPCKVYHRHFPESECLGDITKIDWTRFRGRVDLLTGGFPCQPHSVAGRRKGSKDERDLWGECVRALSGIRPRYAVFENVPGIITTEHGKTWERIKVDLEQAGYEGIPLHFGAVDVGAPHRRNRVWIVAHAKSKGAGENDGGIWAGTGRIAIRERTNKKIPNASNANGSGNPRSGTDRNGQEKNEGREELAQFGVGGQSGVAQDPLTVRRLEREHGEQGRIGDKREPCSRDKERVCDEANTSDGWLNASRATHKQGTFGVDKHKEHDNGSEFWNDIRDGGFPRWEAREHLNEIISALCRVDDGLPRQLHRVQRLKALGNAIVPQCAQIIFEAITPRSG
jgi:DNA (cytosine-5)-methyltransferase 1